VRALIKVLSIVLPCGTILEAADLFRRIGWVFYPEQFFAAMFGLAGTLVYLAVPAGKGRERKGPVPWYDKVAAGLTFIGWTYIAIDYPSLSEFSSNFPPVGLLAAVVVILLLIEGLRRTSGMAITLVVVGFMALALICHLLPGALTGNKIGLDRLLYYLTWDSTAIVGMPLKIISTIVVAFIMFGQALALTGGSSFFTDFSMVIMGKYRGGPAKIAIVASSLFGTISGSTVANVAATGVVTIPLMKQSGYRAHIAGAIEAVASTGGQLMPPVMGVAAFLMAEFLQVPYAEVCIAAIIPSLLFYGALFIEADLEAGRFGISRVPREKIPPALPIIKNGWFFSVPFIVLIVMIFWFNYPIQESALFAGAIIVAFSVIVGYKGKRLRLRGLVEILRTTGINTLQIFMIGAGAGIVIGVLNITGLGFGLTISLIQIAGGSLLLLLVLAAIVSIILGMGMPTGAVYILLATLVAPALIEMKIDPMAAHLFILYYGMMSMVTPPVAIGAFAAASLSGADAMQTGYAAMRFSWTAFVIPFLFVFSGTLILRGDVFHIIIDVATAISGIWFISAAVIGYTTRRIGALYRGVCAITGLGLLIPIGLFAGGRYLNVAGACLAIILLFTEFSARQKMKALALTSGSEGKE
jgi:TRAP transporter 4TM/12TM fusion protein